MQQSDALDAAQRRFLNGVGPLLKAVAPSVMEPSVDSSELTLLETAGLYTITSPFHRVNFLLDRLHEARGGLNAELQVSAAWKDDLIGTTDLNLKSDSSREKIARALKAHDPDTPWRPLLEQCCAKVLRHYRTGEPLATLSSETPIEPLTFTINPLVFERKISVLYSNGGQGKSTLALLLAMIAASGGSAAGLSALKGNSLYLDFEDDLSVHARRLHAIQAGHPALRSARVSYLRCVEPLHKFANSLLRQIHQEKIRFVVVDSILAATGGDSSAEATTQLFIALRSLNVSILLIGHTPKTLAEGHDAPTLYGSVFNSNFARATWELQKDQEIGEDRLVIGLHNRKSNLARLHPPIGLQITHYADGNRIVFEPHDLCAIPQLEKGLPLQNRIRRLLESDGVPGLARTIAEELDASLSSVRVTLSRHDRRKWMHLDGGQKEHLWTALKAQNDV